ncbi:MAG TPA: DUF2795 domain-containing protein [Acidimicrobiia bacterium]|nr:DUF2795 domain-containing protein [Acidimicrobiia bacterium]
MHTVTRIEIADTVSDAFNKSGAHRSELLTAAATNQARPEVLDLIEQLPDRHYRAINELWEHIGHVPVGA